MRFVMKSLAVAGAAVMLATGSAAAAPPDLPTPAKPKFKKTIQPSLFGMHVHELSEPVPQLTQKFGSIRIWDNGVRWDQINTAPGVYDWTLMDQVVANADSGVNSLADMKGKGLAVQPKGNTAEFISQQALEVYGMKYDDMGRVSYVSYTDAVSLMKDNNAQAFTLGTTVPASAIMDLASARDIKLISIPDDKFQAMRKLNPGYTKLVIPAGSYPKQTADVQTIGYATHVIARCDLDADAVYKVLKGMVDNKGDLAAIAKAMAGTTPKMMAEDIGVPLHKGAEKFYKEAGVL